MKWEVESGTAIALTDRREVKWNGEAPNEVKRVKVERGKRPFFLFLVLLLLFSSCHARKKVVSSMAHATDYEWMTAKMSGEVTVEEGAYPFSGTLRMRRDNTIWISASALMGMEAVRARITCDSVVVVNRLDKTYLSEPLADVAVSLQLPLTLQESQALLLGDGRSDHVELCFGPYKAKIRYDDIRWNEPTTFPVRIGPSYERRKL